MAETTKVDAEIIEEGISPLSKAELWLAEARGRVSELAAQYRVPEEIADEGAYRDAKASRAAVRKDAAELDSERKRMTREMDDALKRFRTDVKGVLEPLTDLDAAYRAALDEYEARWGAQRRADLQEAYDEYAPDLVPLVPLDRLITRYGSERGKGWIMRSTNVEAAKAGLRGAIDSIAAGERTVAASVDPEDLEGAKADYFAHLDLGRAISDAQARAEQRERVRRLEEERRAREAEYRRLEEERRAREEEARRLEEERRAAQEAAEAARAAKDDQAPTEGQTAPQIAPQRPVETGSVVSREEAAALWEQTTPNMPKPSIVEQVAITMGTPDADEVPPYVFCGYGTKAQAEYFAEFCRRNGIKRFYKGQTHGRQYKLAVN